MQDAPNNTPTSVYRYYDRFGVLIYVGITNQATGRNQQHNRDKEWWPFVASQEVDHYADRITALALERSLIGTFQPPFNTVHNPDHRSLRTSYLEMSAKTPTTLNLADHLAERNWIDLEQMTPLGHYNVAFRTRPQDAVVAVSLVFSWQKSIVDDSGRNLGQIQQVKRAGPIAVFLGYMGQDFACDFPARARIKGRAVKGPLTCELAHIQFQGRAAKSQDRRAALNESGRDGDPCTRTVTVTSIE